MAHFLNSRCSTNRSMLMLLDGMIIYDLWYERVMKVLQRLTLVAPTLKKGGRTGAALRWAEFVTLLHLACARAWQRHSTPQCVACAYRS